MLLITVWWYLQICRLSDYLEILLPWAELHNIDHPERKDECNIWSIILELMAIPDRDRPSPRCRERHMLKRRQALPWWCFLTLSTQLWQSFSQEWSNRVNLSSACRDNKIFRLLCHEVFCSLTAFAVVGMLIGSRRGKHMGWAQRITVTRNQRKRCAFEK